MGKIIQTSLILSILYVVFNVNNRKSQATMNSTRVKPEDHVIQHYPKVFLCSNGSNKTVQHFCSIVWNQGFKVCQSCISV